MKSFLRTIGSYVFPPLIYLAMRMIWYTTEKKFHYSSEINPEQSIYICWHGELFMSPQAYRHLHKKHTAFAMVSQHYDGELISKAFGLLDIQTIRGSTRKGAQRVLLQAFRTLKKGNELLLTPDGPKGPRHVMHDGALGLALKSKVPLVIVNYKASKYWQFNSWDRFVIPKPFAVLDFYFETISLEGMEFEEARVYLRNKMLENTILT